jgi:hypothetical protein
MTDPGATTIWQEARSSLRGVVRMARFDPDALKYFNLTLDGYWRSFFAAVLLLPIYLVIWFGAGSPGQDAAAPLARRLLIEGINYPLAWTLWPLVSFYIARAVGWGEERYLAYVTAYNWTQIFSQGVMLLAALVFLPTLEPAARLNLWLMMLLGFLIFEAYVAKRTLGITWLQAGALEILLFVITEAQGAVKDFVLAA